MNSEVHPAVAALVLFVAAMAVAIWMWGSGVAAGFGGPAELRTGPDGHRFVQIQNYLVEHDANGAYLETHDLEEMGVELFLGGYAFFSNGDILLRRGPDQRSFFDNVRAYRRETNLVPIVPESPESGLFRCSLDTLACTRFGEEGIDFKAAYSVFIDWESDEVYFSDTTRHLLRKYASNGAELAPPGAGFKFPNQLLLHDGQLLVADTNHHVIRIVEPESTEFAQLVEDMDVVPGAATLAKQTWPSHFARVGHEWWVNNMQTGMNLGGIYVFDNEWQYSRRIDLPADADPISILPVGDTVWVSDWNNDTVWRFSASGQPLADLESEGLKAILESSRQERLKYNILSYAGVAAVVLLFLILVLRSFTSGPSKTRHRDSALDEAVSDVQQGRLHLEPDEKMRKRMNRMLSVAGALLLLAVAGVFINFEVMSDPEVLLVLALPFAGVVLIGILMAWVNRANWGTSVTVDGDTVTLTDHTGRQSRCPIRQVRYDKTAIATRDTVVILGLPNAQIYKRSDIQEKLLPRLAEAREVGPLAMLRIQIEARHPQGMVAVLTIVGLLGFGIVQILS
ncbi:MAG: hypothetical protein QNI96_14715 [Woeseiaceae bacterium]|nr:hypothetical protein [Woeseiaceae bacterium]